MPYGHMTPKQRAAVARYVAGCKVTDLGAGDLGYATILLDLGAASVVAVDKPYSDYRHVVSPSPLIRRVDSLFKDFNEAVDVAFLSWPANHTLPGLIRILSNARIIVYLGKNTDGSMCGNLDLFKFLLRREVLAYLPDPRSTFIIYGQLLVEPRAARGEEASVLGEEFCTFMEAEHRMRLDTLLQAQDDGVLTQGELFASLLPLLLAIPAEKVLEKLRLKLGREEAFAAWLDEILAGAEVCVGGQMLSVTVASREAMMLYQLVRQEAAKQ